MSALTWAAVLHFAAMPACTVPGMVPRFWPSVVHQESGYDPLALHDDTAGQSYHPASLEAAEAIAVRLMAQGHSVGVGLSQLTARSEAQFFDKFDLSIREALAPCANMRAGARHYVNGALSIYNTGNPTAGITNGYVRNIVAQVDGPVPDHRLSARLPARPVDPPINEVFARPVIKISTQR